MRGFPFDSQIIGQDENGMPLYDRASDAADFAELISSFLTSGVFGDGMCTVLSGGGMTATIGEGRFLIEGRFGIIDEPETVEFAVADSSPRIDTVVLRRDLSGTVNDFVAAVVKGTPSASPVAPALTRDGTIWEIGLADVYIPANSTSVSQSNITDTRLDNNRCGLVAAILTDLDTTTVHMQFYSLLQEMRGTLQSVYDTVEMVNITEVSAVLSASGWSEEEPYTQTVSADDVLGSDKAFVDVDMTGATTLDEMLALMGGWGLILKADTGSDTVTFTAAGIPEIDIPVKVKVVR